MILYYQDLDFREFTIRHLLTSSELYRCYKKEFYIKDATKLPDLLNESNKQPRSNKTIFFLVTNCLHDGLVRLTARQACAIESAARINAELDIFVLFSSPAYIQDNLENGVVKSLSTYENVHLRYSNPWRFTEGTPAEDFFKNGFIFKSPFAFTHLSDLLRIVTLWKWGGTYMDLDIIMLKNIANIRPNFAAPESGEIIANGVMNFQSQSFGHYIVDTILKDFMKNYREDLWGHNGPLCITRVLVKEICLVKVSQITADNCHGFYVMPKSAFYAIGYENYIFLFEERHLDAGMKLIENAILVHAWNKLSSGWKVKVGSKVLFGVLAEKHCPKVYSSCGENF